jgi:hypothetical protein
MKKIRAIVNDLVILFTLLIISASCNTKDSYLGSYERFVAQVEKGQDNYTEEFDTEQNKENK